MAGSSFSLDLTHLQASGAPDNNHFNRTPTFTMEQDPSSQPASQPTTSPAQASQSGGPASVDQANWAPLGDRVLATLIDCVLAALIAIPVIAVFTIATFFVPLGFFSFVQVIISMAIYLGAFWLWNKDTLPTTGQTVGKKIMGVRIVRSDGYLADGNDLLIKRYGFFFVAPSIPFIGFLIGLANLIFLFIGPQQPLHDRVGGTRVIKAGGKVPWNEAHPIFAKLGISGGQQQPPTTGTQPPQS